MDAENEMNTAARRETETTETPADGQTTEDRRETVTTPDMQETQTTIKIRRQIAMLNATCPNCGVTNGGHPNMIRRYKTDGKVLYVKCHACDHNFKIVVTE